MDTDTVQLPAESNDIFSLTDQVLSDRLEFIEEIGFGNWGSVWLCKPKPVVQDGVLKSVGQKLAVKLVHRSKTSTTAARVRSLWNEMKIVRSFKSDPHPSIIPFHSFIITPSYALITMTYLPTLVPVEVEETKAREWFRFLLSGVEFLHKRGVVHNDIKPANILLSYKNVPVLVDFGFAEKYDMTSDTAFHSNLSYGTPEYLSPERARGLPHDTRKSDVWSLGITFFEILVGRTPFEHCDGEQFSSNEDLEKYWSRTLRGKWVGTWKFSKQMEKLLQRMISPNADLRCTAMQAIADSYWHESRRESLIAHRRASSYNSSLVFENPHDDSINMTPSRPSQEDYMQSPPGLDASDISLDFNAKRPALSKSRSQPRVAASSKLVQPRKRVPVPPVAALSPIKASPAASPYTGTATAKENILSFNRLAAIKVDSDKKKNRSAHQDQENHPARVTTVTNNNNSRRPFGITTRDNLPRPITMLSKKPSGNTHGAKAVKVLGDIRNTSLDERDRSRESTSAKDRVREWEREKERLREMERLQESEKERDELYKRDKERKQSAKAKKKEQEETNEDSVREKKNASVLAIKIPVPKRKDSDKENGGSSQYSPMLPVLNTGTPLTQSLNIASDTPPTAFGRSVKGNIFKHSIKASIDKTVQLYKMSAGKSTPARGFSFDVIRPNHEPKASTKDGKEAWEIAAEESLPEISPLPVIRNAAESEQMAADSRADRMTIWMKNVEKVVEDAKQNFASSTAPKDVPLPALPLPLARDRSHNRTSRLPRRVLAASQIFQSDEHGNISPMDQTANSSYLSPGDATKESINPASLPGHGEPSTPENRTSQLPSEDSAPAPIPEIYTPSRPRRATVSSPKATFDAELDSGSPSKRKEKSKSHGNLFQRHIAPIAFLEAEINKVPPPPPALRLSQVIDRNYIIAPVHTSRDDLLNCDSVDYDRSRSFDELTSSPLHVEPYPQRQRQSHDANVPDTPSRHRIEGVYDRFLMATSGVKRLGKGYQSDNIAPAVQSSSLGVSAPHSKGRHFYSTRRPMPPPVSSDDQRRATSFDELGVMAYADLSGAKAQDGNSSVSLVRKAINLMVPKASASRRMSRMG